MNEGEFHGSMLENALQAFGAEKHRQVMVSFCRENGIDLMNLQELLPEVANTYCVAENYKGLLGRYPFADFDKAYYMVDRECPLEGILGAYIRNNIMLFFEADCS